MTVGHSNGSNANVTIISQGNQQNNSGYQIITGETKPSVDSNNAKSSFVRVGENQWYYYDQYGQKVKGEKVIDGKAYYFLENGLQARDSLVKGSDGYTYYYDKNGVKAINGFYDFAGYRKDVRYFDCYGHMATGLKWVAQPSTLIHKQVSKLKTSLFASQMAVSVTSSLILVIWL